jgi:hypothetical protein
LPPYYADAAAAAQGSMTQLFRSLVQIALLRKDPSVLPASIMLAGLLVIAYGVASAIYLWVLYENDRIFSRTLVKLGIVLVPIWLLLISMRRAYRFPQAISAVLGILVLMTPILTILVLLMQGQMTADPAVLLFARGLYYAVTVWFLVIVGHILKGALDAGLITCVAIAVVWWIASDFLSRKLFLAVA